MKFDTDTRGDVLILHVSGDRSDAACVIEFKDLMYSATSKTKARVILNLEKVTFIDSSGLGAIVSSMKALGHARKLNLCSLSTFVQNVFRLTRLDKIFYIFEDMDQALGKLKQPKIGLRK